MVENNKSQALYSKYSQNFHNVETQPQDFANGLKNLKDDQSEDSWEILIVKIRNKRTVEY